MGGSKNKVTNDRRSPIHCLAAPCLVLSGLVYHIQMPNLFCKKYFVLLAYFICLFVLGFICILVKIVPYGGFKEHCSVKINLRDSPRTASLDSLNCECKRDFLDSLYIPLGL